MLAFALEQSDKYLKTKEKLKSFSLYLETTPPSSISISIIKQIEALLAKLYHVDSSPKTKKALIKASTLVHTPRTDENFTKLLLDLMALLKAIK